MSSLGCKALCIVFNFFVLGFIFLSSSLTPFKNGFKYFTWVRAQDFFFFKSQQQILVRRSFLLLPRNYSYFSSISAYLLVFISNISDNLYISFSPSILILSDLVVLFLIPFFIRSRANFHWQISFLYPGCIFLLLVSYFIFCKQFYIQ